MSPVRLLTLPLLCGLLVGLPVWWAFPEELGFWRSCAIVSGWLGCGLLLASLLLMVREPRLAAWLGGLERMYRWHHRFGTLAYLVLLTHPLALAADAWEESPALARAALAPWQQGWPVWLGWASLLAMMAGMGLAVARRLPYAAWRGLHLLLALAVVLGVVHLLLLGLDNLLLWAPLLAVAIMAGRFVLADTGLAARPHVVERVGHPAAAMVEVVLRPLAQPIRARPGQFVLAAFLRGSRFRGCGEYHPFTLSDIGEDGHLALDIKALGDCTRHLQAVEPGVAVRVQGPFGTFLGDDPHGPALWIAGGIGITPFVAVLRHGKLRHPVTLIYLYRDSADGAHLEELRAASAGQAGLRLDARATGDARPDLEAIIPAAAELAGRDCHLCGPPGLVDAAVAVLLARGVPRSRIHFERFDFR
ncbi:MAG TPA: ferric reductase-like transmembrane domain-containing protein [Rhodocyclaceae bacterium]|nr:ferric reductase-like transmembrane domain-containing protein [Rhodocyclaceae bacterium]